jgi:murein DD-endopeptidase MepM/ murein hydrolase activator NlpD
VLPVAAGDTATTFFGLAPFAIHFGDTGRGGHGLDGHPGWDVEFRPGAQVRAAADGVVQSVFTDSFTTSRSVIQIQHQAGGNFRTVYTNIESPAAGIAANAAVTRGQVLGLAGTQSTTVERRTVSYGMTHFQVDDFSRNEGATNPNAVNPETFLDSSGRTLFDAVWNTPAYNVELTEPFTGNTRDTAFPISRTWTPDLSTAAVYRTQ